MKRKILIAEDNRAFRMMLSLVFSEQYEVQTVDNGVALEQALAKGDYDLLISDLNLPLKGAASVLRTYERQEKESLGAESRLVPALIVTGMEMDCEEVQSIQRLVNVKQVLQKPVDVRELKRRVDDLLRIEDVEPICSQIRRAVEAMPHVLVVDDEPEIRQYIYALLDAAGIQATTCASADEAARLCSKNVYDLILLDYVLEEGVADDLLERLPEAARATRLPWVYIVSGFDDSLSMDRFAKYPTVRGILAKPFEPGELIEKVKATLAAEAPCLQATA
ncbi:MAG: response regulator [Planctomycetes bacterium]|nr:response regulator [Planctomycetota bacterium]